MIVHFGVMDEFLKELETADVQDDEGVVEPRKKTWPRVCQEIVRVCVLQKPVGGGMPNWDMFLLATARMEYGPHEDALIVRYRRLFGDVWPGMNRESNEKTIAATEAERDELTRRLTALGFDVRSGMFEHAKAGD